ncbi:MAG: AAA family ATPase, partial [Nanoarchaeota archaeon]|nr:AAA family ATPase [Nanoarchaeota archaeon]
MYVGLTGYMGTGKGEVAKKLTNQGYKSISLSNIVRQEADKRGLKHTRENLQDVGNDLRRTYGPGILALRIRETIENEEGATFGTGKWVIDGIRNPHEAAEIKRIPHSSLLAVTSSLTTITNRIKTRHRPGEENLTKEE